MRLSLKRFFKLEYLLLLLVILLGSWFRLEGVITKSFAFTYDVGRDMLSLWNLVYNYKISLIGFTTGMPGVFYGPWWYWMLAPFFFIFKGSPQGIAFIMSAVGTVTIWLLYVLGKRIGGVFLGLTFSALASVSAVLISLSSQIWNPNIAPLFVVLAFLVLGNIYKDKLKKKRLKYYFLLGFLLALIIDIEIVFGLFFSIGILISLFVALKRNILLKQFLVFLLGFLIVVSPRILFELRHGFIMSKSLVKYLSVGDSAYKASSLIDTIVNRTAILFNQFANTLASGSQSLGIALLLLMVISFVLFYKKAEEEIKLYINTSIIILLVFLIGTILFSHDIWDHYLVGLPILYILLFGVSLYLLNKNFPRYKLFVVLAIIIFLINLNPSKVVENINKPLWEGDASVYRNQLSVVDYIYSEAQGGEFKYVTYTPPIHDYTYQYLFNWYGLKEYGYTPAVKASVAFFILEPDNQYPERLVNWLNERKEDGEIVKSEEIKGGIVVQTRLVD